MENSKKLEGRFTSKPSDVKRTAVIGAGVMGSGKQIISLVTNI